MFTAKKHIFQVVMKAVFDKIKIQAGKKTITEKQFFSVNYFDYVLKSLKTLSLSIYKRF